MSINESMDLNELLKGCDTEPSPEVEKKLATAARIARHMDEREVIPPENIFGPRILSRLMMITPKLAEILHSKNVAAFQRNINTLRLEDLMQKICDRRFHGNKIGLALFQNRLILMNGQHSLLAIMNTQKTEECWVQVVKCDTEAQVGCYWAQFDDDGNRSPKQQCAALASSIGEDWNKDSSQVMSIACSIDRYKTAAKGVAGTLQERVQLISQYGDHAKVARDIIFDSENSAQFARIFRRGPVATAILKTVKSNPEDAKKFWASVATGLNMDRTDDPRKVLRDYLLNFKGSNTGKRTDSDNSLLGKCLMAWNYYRQGIDAPRRGRSSTPTLIYNESKEMPKAL